jgi:type II secretory pathway component PulM
MGRRQSLMTAKAHSAFLVNAWLFTSPTAHELHVRPLSILMRRRHVRDNRRDLEKQFNARPKWQRQLLALAAMVLVLMLGYQFILSPVNRMTANRLEEKLASSFVLKTDVDLVAEGAPADAKDAAIDRQCRQLAEQMTPSQIAINLEYGVMTAYGRFIGPVAFEKMEAYLRCAMTRATERFCQPASKARLVTSFKAYLAQLNDNRSVADSSGIFSLLRNERFENVKRTISDAAASADAGDDAGDPWSDTAIDQSERKQEAAERQAEIRKAQRLDGPSEELLGDLRDLAQRGFISASDFASFLGFGVPASVDVALSDITPVEGACP